MSYEITLEVLKANKGDCILLQFKKDQDCEFILVDGGAGDTYTQYLCERLFSYKKYGPLNIRLVIASHIDNDHIDGLIDLTNALIARKNEKLEPEFIIKELWHNSFEDIVGEGASTLELAAKDNIDLASFHSEGKLRDDISYHAALILAGVANGRELRNNAKRLGIEIESSLIADSNASADRCFFDDVETWILWPDSKRWNKLKKEWKKKTPSTIKKKKVDAAAYLDRSIANLSSIVVLFKRGETEILLTGDARGDHVLKGLKTKGLVNEKKHISVLKVPHHGSLRSNDRNFFEVITADYYILSCDGSHGNPHPKVIEMILDSRKGDTRAFKLVLTYEIDEMIDYHGKNYPKQELKEIIRKGKASGLNFDVLTPKQEKSVIIAL